MTINSKDNLFVLIKSLSSQKKDNLSCTWQDGEYKQIQNSSDSLIF